MAAPALKQAHRPRETFSVVTTLAGAWVQAGFTLVKAADVGIYMDVVDASELISAHITTSPSQAVRLPCAENYPTVLADRAADDEVLFDAARSRLVEEQRTHQTKALKGAAAAHAGGGDPLTVGPPPDGGDVVEVASAAGAGPGRASEAVGRREASCVGRAPSQGGTRSGRCRRGGAAWLALRQPRRRSGRRWYAGRTGGGGLGSVRVPVDDKSGGQLQRPEGRGGPAVLPALR